MPLVVTFCLCFLFADPVGSFFSLFVGYVFFLEDWGFFFVAFYGFLQRWEYFVSVGSCDQDVDEFFAYFEFSEEVVDLYVGYSFFSV